MTVTVFIDQLVTSTYKGGHASFLTQKQKSEKATNTEIRRESDATSVRTATRDSGSIRSGGCRANKHTYSHQYSMRLPSYAKNFPLSSIVNPVSTSSIAPAE